MRKLILNLFLLIAPSSHKPYLQMAVALEPVFTPGVADEITDVAQDGTITWADWLRIGRHAGIKKG